MFHNFTKAVKIDPIITYTAAGQTDITTTGLALAGFDGIACHVLIGDVTTAATVNLHAEMSTAVGGTYVDCANSAAYFSSTQGSSGVYLICEVYKPTQNFVRFIVDRGDANTQILGGMAYRYRAWDLPVAESTYASSAGVPAIIDYTLTIQPASGSATG